MKNVKCPFCATGMVSKNKWVYCDTCGNGFSAKKNEVKE